MPAGVTGRGDAEVARAHVRDFVRAGVRAGLLDDEALYDEARAAVVLELPDLPAESTAASWVEEFRNELSAEAATWPETTDYDRLQHAFTELAATGLVVLQGCEDHWGAKAELERRQAIGEAPRGIAWFLPADVWHAVDHGMLEVNVWHGSTANVAPGDALLDEVLAVLGRHDLPAHFDEGRIEVTAYWHRRP